MRPVLLLRCSILGGVPVALSQTLQSVLLDNDLNTFAALLEGSEVHHFGGDNLIIYAPTDAAFEANGGAAVAKRVPAGVQARGIYISQSTLKDSKPQSSTSKSQPATRTTTSAQNKRTPGSVLAARQDPDVDPAQQECGIVRETWLNDPDLVSLGPGRNQTILEKNVCGMSRPLIFTGLGASVKVTADDIPFDRGVVRPVSGVFTLPRKLSETLPFLGASRFLNALTTTGLFSDLDLDGLASITVLAPTDATFKKETTGLSPTELRELLKRHILVDDGYSPAYTPFVRNGEVYPTLLDGQGVIASVVGDGSSEVVRFGNSEVSAGDAIIQNGVVHTVNQVLTEDSLVPIAQPSPSPSPLPTTGAPSSTSTGGPSEPSGPVVTAAAVSLKGLSTAWLPAGLTLLAGVMAVVMYY